MTGTGSSRRSVITRFEVSCMLSATRLPRERPSAGELPMAPRSAPTQNALPAPVIRHARTDAAERIRARASRISSWMECDSGFSLDGLFSVIVAMPSLTPYRIEENSMGRPRSASSASAGFVGADVAEQVPRDLAHLDLFRAFRDAIATVVTIDVLERLVTRIADTAMHLHGTVRRLADEPVGPVVAHGDLVGEPLFDLRLGHAVHFPCRLANEQTQHFHLSSQFHQRELDALVAGQLLPERLALASILDAFTHAVISSAKAGSCLANA